MYDLIKINENDYYIDYPSKIGIVKIGENDVVLIDSGNDSYAGKKTLKILNENGWNLKAIYNTHSHADHIGGNKYLTEKTGCKAYAYQKEYVFSSVPILEPISLYGALPLKELKNKFLMAEESNMLPLSENDLPNGMKIINLPGHSYDMVGFLTKDNTAYIGDVVSSKATFEKYGICFYLDYEQAINSLEEVKNIPAEIFVPSHAEATTDITPLADYNILALKNIEKLLVEICRTPITFESLLKQVFDRFGISMNAQQYALIGSTCRSFLTVLHQKGIIDFEFSDNNMLWKAN